MLYNRNPRDRVEKVAPWLTIDGDPYPAIVDGRIVWILDGYTTTDRYPCSRAGVVRDDDRRLAADRRPGCGRCRPTRSTTCATRSRRPWTPTTARSRSTRGTSSDPILEAWRSGVPRHGEADKSDIPPALMAHLRYPEDLFKVQRYQFARYHVDRPGRLLPGQQPLAGARRPEQRRGQPAAAVPALREPADGANGASTSTFSLTSVFTPYGKNNLAAFVSVDSDADRPEDLRQDAGAPAARPAHARARAWSPTSSPRNEEVRQKLQPFQLGDAPPIFGNLLTLPVDDGLIYVEPVYAVRAGSTVGLPDPAVRAGLLRRQRRHRHHARRGARATCSTCRAARRSRRATAAARASAPATGSVDAPAPRPALDKADAAFARADAALARKDFAAYGKQIARAQRYVNQALSLAEQRKASKNGP